MTTGSIQEKSNKLYCVLNFKDENGKRTLKWVKTGLPAKGNKKRGIYIRRAFKTRKRKSCYICRESSWTRYFIL